MSFDRETLERTIASHGRVARIVVLDSAGSVPRGAGTAMLVWDRGQDGTIGGGTLEFGAVKAARSALETGRERHDRLPLGPALGQCCGGLVRLLTEIWDTERLHVAGNPVVRPLPGTTGAEPLAMARARGDLRAGKRTGLCVAEGWVLEPVCQPDIPLWIYGAGHVGRAIVHTLHPLPQFAITWVDTGIERFPEVVPRQVEILPAANPADAVALAPANAQHLVLTYSHALDLEICHRLLGHGFAGAGLIGSATKWARFRKRLAQLGHRPDQIDRITCPIGEPALGKHPQAIAVGVVSRLVSRQVPRQFEKAARA